MRSNIEGVNQLLPYVGVSQNFIILDKFCILLSLPARNYKAQFGLAIKIHHVLIFTVKPFIFPL